MSLSGAIKTKWVFGSGLAVAAFFVATAPAGAFLEGLICGMDPLYDLCVSIEIENQGSDLRPGFQRDRAFLDGYAGWHFAHRNEADRDFQIPDPVHYRGVIASGEMDQIVTALHNILVENDPAGAEANIASIERASIQRLAYSTVARAYLFTGDNERAVVHLNLFKAAIEGIEKPPSRLQPLADLAWYFAQAGDTEGANENLQAMLAIAQSHPISQLRPIFAVESAPAVFLLEGEDAALARIAAARDELDAMSNLPPGFEAQARSNIAKAYGRIGHKQEGRVSAQRVLALIDDLETGQRVAILRNLFEAGFEF